MTTEIAAHILSPLGAPEFKLYLTVHTKVKMVFSGQVLGGQNPHQLSPRAVNLSWQLIVEGFLMWSCGLSLWQVHLYFRELSIFLLFCSKYVAVAAVPM